MITGILGTKSGMLQTFTRNGQRVAVSVVKIEPNLVTFVKTQDKDGYWGVQLGTGSKKIKNIRKPELGHLKKLRKDLKTAPRYLREIKLTANEELKTGDTIRASDVLKPGDLVKVTGVSKGKGFAGGVKRWGFAGGPKTHGQSDRLRAPGSIGQGTTPGRVYKGKKMAGRMGGGQVSVKNLTVLKVEENGDVWLSGPVPGFETGLLQITKIGENKKFVELYEKDEQSKSMSKSKSEDEILSAPEMKIEEKQEVENIEDKEAKEE